MKKILIMRCAAFLLMGMSATANAASITWNFDPSGGAAISNVASGTLGTSTAITFQSGGVNLEVQSVTADWAYGASNQVTGIELGQTNTSGDLGKKITSAEGLLVNPSATLSKGLGTGGDNLMTGWTVRDGTTTNFTDAYTEWLAFKVPTGYVFTEVKLFGLAADEKVQLQYAKRPERKYNLDGNTNFDTSQIMTGIESAGTVGNSYTTFLIANIIADPTDPAFQWLAVAVQPFGITSASSSFSNYTTYGDFQIASITATTAPVPEPATMLLLGSGLIGLAGFGRKKLFKKR